MNYSNYPFSNFPWVEYNHRLGRYMVSPQRLSMYLTGSDSPVILKAVEDLGRTRPIIFRYANGYYYPVSWNKLNGLIKSFMPPELRTSRNVKDVIYEIETERSVSRDVFDSDEDIVNFANGIYHISSGKLTKHTPKVLSSIQISCKFDADLTLERDAPVFSKYLNDLTSGDALDQTFLLEYIGAILSNVPGYRFKKCLFLVGRGDTGKSQLRQLVSSLIGSANCQTIDLSKLNDRFSTSQLYGIRLGGSGDVASIRVQEMATLKNLTGGDDVNAEYKGKDAFSFKYRGFLWFNANDLPPFGGDRGKHVYDRFSIIQCNNVISPEHQDKELLDKLMKEKDAIASVSIKYLAAAVKRGYTFTESESMIASREEYMERNNSLVVFVRDRCEMTGRTKRSTFRRIYLEWCKSENAFPEQTRNIDTTLREYFDIVPIKASEYYYPLTIKDSIRLAFSYGGD